MEEKLYWSGWSFAKNVYFINKTNGTSIIPANWRDVWSFQLNTRYATTDKIALLSSIIYETNPVPLATNAIGYPLSASGAITAGLDLTLANNFSTQLMYSYGAFVPQSKIDNAGNKGFISANFQAVIVQLTYKA